MFLDLLCSFALHFSYVSPATHFTTIRQPPPSIENEASVASILSRNSYLYVCAILCRLGSMPPKKLKKSKSMKEDAQTADWLAAVKVSQERTTEQLQDTAVSKVSSALAIQTKKSQPNTLMDFSFSSSSSLSSLSLSLIHI